MVLVYIGAMARGGDQSQRAHRGEGESSVCCQIRVEEVMESL